jgi:Spy/CpxP family protein refolding chaperone
MSFQSHRVYSIAFSALLMGVLTTPMAAMAQKEPEKPSTSMKTEKHHKWDGKHKEAHQQFMKELNLTDQQKQQLKAAHEKFRQENAGAIAAMKAKREKLKALGNDPANEAQKQQLKTEMKQEWETMRAKKKASMQGILTPEQQAKWDAKKAERKAQWQTKHAQRSENREKAPQ